MKCHESKTIIYIYHDGEASEKQQASLFSHLKECSACRQEMVRAQGLQELLVKNCSLVDDVPQDFRDGIMAKIDALKQTPVKEIQARSVIRKRKFWETKFGIGLLAGAAGLLLTYYMVASIPNTNIASKDAVPKAEIIQDKAQTNLNTQLAEAKKTYQEPVIPNAELEKPNPKPTPKPTLAKKPEATAPLKVAQAVTLRIANPDPVKGVVDLPKPLSISKYIYNENLTSDSAVTAEKNIEQPLNSDLPKLVGSTLGAKIFNHSLQIITQSAGTAKLWQLDPTIATKPRELASIEVTGLVVNSSNKLINLEAEKAAVSSAGVIATITNANNALQLSIGDKSITLDGNVISDLTWSPDGNKVLYFIENGKLGHLESYDGENRIQLTPDMPAQAVAWTFVDENKLILNIQTDTPGIWELQLTDAKLTQLAGVGGGNCVARNSKNDIAFTDTTGKIYVLFHAGDGTKKSCRIDDASKIYKLPNLDD